MYRLFCSICILILTTSTFFAQQKSPVATSSLSDRLIAKSQEWVNTWNDRDVNKLRSLHAKDISAQLYGIGEELYAVDKLLEDIIARGAAGIGPLRRLGDPDPRRVP